MPCPVNDTNAGLPFLFPLVDNVIGNLTENRGVCAPHMVTKTLGDKNITGISYQDSFWIFSEGLASLEWPWSPVGKWTSYSARIVISRLVDYKLFLLQLILQHPRPRTALGTRGEAFSTLHMAIDPIDSLGGYFATLAECRNVLKSTKRELSKPIGPGKANPCEQPPDRWHWVVAKRLWGCVCRSELEDETDRRAKVIALVFLAYKTNGHQKKLENLIR